VKKFQIIILAAGQGTRLMPLTIDKPKTMVMVNGKPLIDYIFSTFDPNLIKNVAIVVGHCGQIIKDHFKNSFKDISIDYVENEIHDKTNSTYSLWLAKRYMKDDIIIINADTIFHKDILSNLMNSSYESGLAIDDTLSPPLPEEAMKATIKDKVITDVSKTILSENTDGDAIGMYKFSGVGLKILIEELDNLINNSVTDKLFTFAVQRILKKTKIYSITTEGKPWIEVDDANDLNDAKTVASKIEL
tara:strand:+ start:1216 stop:1953 length:738 start_codon:yes stop_codon:yes gene_type:complete